MNFDIKNQPRCRSWFSLSLFITPPHNFPPDTRHGGLLMGHQYVNVFSYYAHVQGDVCLVSDDDCAALRHENSRFAPRSKYPWGAPRNDRIGLSTR